MIGTPHYTWYTFFMQSISHLESLHLLADQADEIALKFFQESTLYVSEKSDHSPVSEADLAIEMMIRRESETLFKGFEMWGEEFGLQNPDAPYKLIIDPIDATRNFVRGIPLFATLMAIEIDGELVAGLVSAPAIGDRWCAQKGFGAWHNTRPIHVSKPNTLATAQVFHGSLYGAESPAIPLGPVLSILSKTQRQRGFGDFYGHMLVAMGAGEACLDFGLMPWDIAPLKVIVETAGGQVTNLDGGFNLANPDIISSNRQIHPEILQEFLY